MRSSLGRTEVQNGVTYTSPPTLDRAYRNQPRVAWIRLTPPCNDMSRVANLCQRCGIEHHKETCPRASPIQHPPLKCFGCGKSGHKRTECTQALPASKCYQCHQTGHKKDQCPQSKVTRLVCYRCGQPGHKQTECSVPAPCSACGQPVHLPWETCPAACPPPPYQSP